MKKNAPHILFITTDQHRATALGCAGLSAVPTPNIDRLAHQGIRYVNAIAQAPVCTPARACWITGQYIRSHGVWANGVPLPDSPDLLPRLMRQAGYGTAMIGKLHVTPSMAANQPEDGAFGYERIRLTEGRSPKGFADWLEHHAPDQVHKYRHSFPPSREGDMYAPAECLPEKLHPSRWVANEAIAAWRQRVQHRPLFMHVSFPDPHHPFEAPQKFVDQVKQENLPARLPIPENWADLPGFFEEHHLGENPLFQGGQKLSALSEDQWRQIQTNYYAMIAFIDQEIGRLVEVVEASGEPFLIVFTADHGELLGDHGLLYKGLFHYDSLIKVPLIVSGSGLTHRGQIVTTPVEQIDLMPTILERCSLTVPRTCQGESLPGISRPITDVPREFTLTEEHAPWYTPERRCVTLRSTSWKLCVVNNENIGLLFDLGNDPDEQSNLWHDPAHAEVKQHLLLRLSQRLIDTAPPGGARTYRA